MHEFPTSSGEPLREYYKEVTVEVLEAIKGVTAEETTITYISNMNKDYIYRGTFKTKVLIFTLLS